MNTSKPLQKVKIICILWGTKYTENDVNRLYSMIERNTSYSVDFHVFSDEALPQLSQKVTQHPSPKLNTDTDHSQYAYRKEAALCDADLGNLRGDRVFFFDLDVLITDNLDELFSYPKDDNFYIIKDWNTRDGSVGQASCYSFVVGTLGFIKKHFEGNAKSIMDMYGSASQEYLSAMVTKEFRKLHFWPENWFKSFRFHCLPPGILRHFKQPNTPPVGAKVIAFHGFPDIESARIGRWFPPGIGSKSDKSWKRLYKVCKPTKWIDSYWH